MYKQVIEPKHQKDIITTFFITFSHPRDFHRLLTVCSDKTRTACGTEVSSVLFPGERDEWEEEYFQGNFVQIILERFVAREDIYTNIPFEVFYSCLTEHCEKYIIEHPEEKDEIDQLMMQIKSRLEL